MKVINPVTIGTIVAGGICALSLVTPHCTDYSYKEPANGNLVHSYTATDGRKVRSFDFTGDDKPEVAYFVKNDVVQELWYNANDSTALELEVSTNAKKSVPMGDGHFAKLENDSYLSSNGFGHHE